MKSRLFAALVVAALALLGFALLRGWSAPSINSGAEAVIIDQLYSRQPNDSFIQQVTEVLEGYGFKVDVYQGDEITVDLYRSLPAQGYKLIIFRAHSSLLSHREGSEIVTRGATAVFTNEPYSRSKHVSEQLDGQLARARVAEGYPQVFAIGARFIKHSMEGQFEDTVVIMMGCYGLYLTDLEQAFVDTGASSYLGWDDLVALNYVDDATITLIQQLYSEELSVAEAVAETMAEEGPDPYYGAVLNYYPPQSGNGTVKELTR